MPQTFLCTRKKARTPKKVRKNPEKWAKKGPFLGHFWAIFDPIFAHFSQKTRKTRKKRLFQKRGPAHRGLAFSGGPKIAFFLA
jgi:hypothetical protein